jgi:nucleoside-diphosphate-sugar epimerase
MLETNVRGTALLLDACRKTGFEAFVNAGSSSEYGYFDGAPSETERLQPNSDYAVTKAFASQFLRSTAQRHGLAVTTLRLYSVYGPWEEETRLLPTLIARGRTGALPPLVGADTARDFIYVDDVTEAFVLAASRPPAEPGAIYNVGTGVQTTIREVVEVARRVLDIAAEPVWGTMPRRPWDTSSWVADSRRIRKELGWEPGHTFEEGFRKMALWANDPR